MPPVGFEPAMSAGERPQTYALDRAATGTGIEGLILDESRSKRIKTEDYIFYLKRLFGSL